MPSILEALTALALLVGTALTLFALAPAMGWADCSDGHKASMASSTPANKPEVAQASATGKATAPVAVKTSKATQVNTVDRKATAASPKAGESTVVAKTN